MFRTKGRPVDWALWVDNQGRGNTLPAESMRAVLRLYWVNEWGSELDVSAFDHFTGASDHTGRCNRSTGAIIRH